MSLPFLSLSQKVRIDQALSMFKIRHSRIRSEPAQFLYSKPSSSKRPPVRSWQHRDHVFWRTISLRCFLMYRSVILKRGSCRTQRGASCAVQTLSVRVSLAVGVVPWTYRANSWANSPSGLRIVFVPTVLLMFKDRISRSWSLSFRSVYGLWEA